MAVPLMVLAALSMVGGFINIPEVLFGSSWLHNFMSPVLATPAPEHALSHSTELILMGVIVVLTVIVIAVAYAKFVKRQQVPIQEGQLGTAHRLLYHKYYVDEIYDSLIVKPVHWLGDVFHSTIETLAIDRFVNGIGESIMGGSKVFRRLQTGSIGFYIFVMVIGIVVMLALTTIKL